jgi:hypothetical protein
MGGSLLQGKRAPPFKIVCAVMLALWIIGSFSMMLSTLHAHHERATMQAHQEGGVVNPGEIMLVTLGFPLSAMAAIFLLIPLFIYITDHAAFTTLSMLRPDHYGKLVWRVYAGWIAAGGKLASKDL